MRIKTKGFTLIELLVVIAIIGLLSTLATVAVRYAMEQAKISKAQQGVDTIYNAITIMSNDTDQWPGHQTKDAIAATTDHFEFCGPDATLPTAQSCPHGLSEGYAGILANDATTPYAGWQGPYMINIPLDPWQHEYFFDTNYYVNSDGKGCGCNGNSVNCHDVVVVGSYGPDGLGAAKLIADGGSANSSSAVACDNVIKIITFQ